MSGSTTEKQYQKETITRTSSDASSYTVSTSDPVLMLENFPIENSIANGTALRCRPFVFHEEHNIVDTNALNPTSSDIMLGGFEEHTATGQLHVLI